MLGPSLRDLLPMYDRPTPALVGIVLTTLEHSLWVSPDCVGEEHVKTKPRNKRGA